MKIHLKKILKDRNITVTQLQNLTGISRSTLTPLTKSDLLPSKTRFDTIEKISKNLRVSEDTLLEFELPKITLADEIILNNEVSDYLAIVKFCLDYKYTSKILYFSVVGRYVPSPEEEYEDMQFRVNHHPSYSKKIFESEKEKARYEKELKEFNKLYDIFKRNLAKKYKHMSKLDSIHLSTLTYFDLENLKVRNNTLFNEISTCEKENFNSNDINLLILPEIAKEFMISSKLKNEPFANYTSDSNSTIDTIEVNVNYEESYFFVRAELEFDRSKKQIKHRLHKGMNRTSAITEAYNIKDPEDFY